MFPTFTNLLYQMIAKILLLISHCELYRSNWSVSGSNSIVFRVVPLFEDKKLKDVWKKLVPRETQFFGGNPEKKPRNNVWDGKKWKERWKGSILNHIKQLWCCVNARQEIKRPTLEGVMQWRYTGGFAGRGTPPVAPVATHKTRSTNLQFVFLRLRVIR